MSPRMSIWTVVSRVTTSPVAQALSIRVQAHGRMAPRARLISWVEENVPDKLTLLSDYISIEYRKKWRTSGRAFRPRPGRCVYALA